MQASPSHFVYLLGSFEIKQSESDRPPALRRKTGAALAYLAATGQPQSRQVLAEMFCQEADDPQRALRSILSRIRQRLGEEILLSEGNRVEFNRQVGWVDCLAFAHVLDQDLEQLPLETVRTAVSLYRGDFLENISLSSSPEFERWLLNERSHYQRLYERGLNTVVARLITQGQSEAAIGYAQALVHLNPLLEEGHAQLMWLYARGGQRAAALAQYEQCRHTLQRELAVAPTPELTTLYQEIVAGQIHPPRPLSVSAVEVAIQPPRSSDFVGRTAEMAQLQQVWQEAQDGRPLVVLLEAEAGMGKTRLIYEFAQTRPEASFLVGDCYESTRALPYSPWLEVLEGQLERLDKAAFRQLSPFAVNYLGRLLPTLARRLGRGRPPALPTSGDALSRLFTAVHEFFCHLSPGPLLLFLDNLQWADEASLQLFHFLARRSSPGKLLLIGAWRSEEAGDNAALQSLISDLQRQPLLHLPLPPLTAQAITELTGQLWPDLPKGYQPHVCEMLSKATGGNPLFVSEILRELAHTTGIPSVLPVPASVRQLIQHRLGLLPETGRQVIEALAVLDSPATLAQVQSTSGRSQAETINALDLALRRGLLQSQSEASTLHYGFSHDMMREAVLSQLTPVRRQLLHQRAARVLERAGAAAAMLAHHWQMAGEAAKEGHYAMLAGEQAAAIFANEEAIRNFERALTLVADPVKRLQMMEKLGNIRVLIGEWETAESIFTQALALAQAQENREWQAHFQGALGKLMSRRGLYAQSLAWLAQARDNCLALGDQGGVASYTGTMGIVYYQKDDYDQALACYQQALDMETARGNKAGIAIWTGNIGAIYLQQGDYDRALAGMEHSLQLRRELGMKLEAGIETGNLGNHYYTLGDYLKALAYHQEAWQIRQELGDRAGMATVLGYLGRDYACLGNSQAALACFQTALQYHLESGNWEGIALQLGRIGEVLAEEGDYPTALAYLDHAIRLFRRLDMPYYLSKRLTAEAKVLFSLGKVVPAQKLNDEALEFAREVEREVEFSARLLAIPLAVAGGQLEQHEAQAARLALLAEFNRPDQEAAIYYEMWQTNRHAPTNRQYAAKAADLYHQLYLQTYDHEYRQRYHELSDQFLPDPPPLPEPPDVVTAEPIPWPILLSQIEEHSYQPPNL
jgi:DNA-binding SARP family transcriptional activator/tetratricopeptide (TPR) repeat protein